MEAYIFRKPNLVADYLETITTVLVVIGRWIWLHIRMKFIVDSSYSRRYFSRIVSICMYYEVEMANKSQCICL